MEAKDLGSENHEHTSELQGHQFQNTTIKADIRTESHEIFHFPVMFTLCCSYVYITLQFIKGTNSIVVKNVNTLIMKYVITKKGSLPSEPSSHSS